MFFLHISLLLRAASAGPDGHDAKPVPEKKKKKAFGFTLDLRATFDASRSDFSMKKATLTVCIVCELLFGGWIIIGFISSWGCEMGLNIYRTIT